MTPLDFDGFDVLTFDVYGTLIDWEAGIAAGLRAVLEPRGIRIDDDDLLECYGRHEAMLEAGPYLPYREILGRGLRLVCAEFDVEPTASECDAFGASVGAWPAFPDSAMSLTALAGRYRLAVITNCDDDLFAASSRRLGVTFDWVVTAQQVRSYKPDPRNFEVALDRIGVPRERVLHVAQSLFHDHAPAATLGITSVWVDRRRGRTGSGATPPASGSPALAVPDLASFARAAGASRTPPHEES